jgi:hypothetical protein
LTVDDAIRIAALLWSAASLFAWAAVLSVEWDDEALLGRRDFRSLYACGERLVHGGNAFFDERLPVLTTPIVLPLARLYYELGLRGAYVLASTLTSIGLLVGAIASASLGEASRERRVTIAIAIVAAPPFYLALHLGQLAGVYFALLAGSLALLLRGRHVSAGALAALLLAKPHLAIGVAGLALLIGARRFFVGLMAGAAIAIALTLPFGAERWAEWSTVLGETSRRLDGRPNGYWKQFTLYAFVRSALYGVDPAGTIAKIVLPVSALSFGAAIVLAIRRLGEQRQEAAFAARLAGVVVLAICALNAYLFYYDALLLALPTAVLATGRWHRPSARWISTACAALIFWLSLAVTWDRSQPQLAGAITTLWLAAELVDLFGAGAAGAARQRADRKSPPPVARTTPAPAPPRGVRDVGA